MNDSELIILNLWCQITKVNSGCLYFYYAKTHYVGLARRLGQSNSLFFFFIYFFYDKPPVSMEIVIVIWSFI